MTRQSVPSTSGEAGTTAIAVRICVWLAVVSANRPLGHMRPEMTVPGGKVGESPRRPGGLTSRRVAAGIPASTTDVGNSPSEQASAAPRVRQRRRGNRGSDMAVPEAAGTDGKSINAIARLLAAEMPEDLLAIIREIFARNPIAERLAYSPDEAAELLGISRELVHDLLRTGQLGSVKAGRRRLIAKHHLEAFLTGEP